MDLGSLIGLSYGTQRIRTGLRQGTLEFRPWGVHEGEEEEGEEKEQEEGSGRRSIPSRIFPRPYVVMSNPVQSCAKWRSLNVF